MATQEDVRRIALALPLAEEAADRFAFQVPHKGRPRGFAWVWMERVHPRRARVPNPGVLAVRVADVDEKQLLLSMDPEKFFTEPHYNGFPAILVRLEALEPEQLEELLVQAWRCLAPREAVEAFDRDEGVNAAREAQPAGDERARRPSRNTATK